MQRGGQLILVSRSRHSGMSSLTASSSLVFKLSPWLNFCADVDPLNNESQCLTSSLLFHSFASVNADPNPLASGVVNILHIGKVGRFFLLTAR